MATQLEELQHDLEWIEYQLLSAHGQVDDLARKIKDDGFPIDEAGQYQAVLAYATSFQRTAKDLVDSVAALQRIALNEWHASPTATDGAAYWDRIADRFRGKTLQFWHEGAAS